MTGEAAEIRVYQAALGLGPGATLAEAQAAYRALQRECVDLQSAGGATAQQAEQRLEAAAYALAQLKDHANTGGVAAVVDRAQADRARLGCLTPLFLVGALLAFSLWPREPAGAGLPTAVTPIESVPAPPSTDAVVEPPVGEAAVTDWPADWLVEEPAVQEPVLPESGDAVIPEGVPQEPVEAEPARVKPATALAAPESSPPPAAAPAPAVMQEPALIPDAAPVEEPAPPPEPPVAASPVASAVPEPEPVTIPPPGASAPPVVESASPPPIQQAPEKAGQDYVTVGDTKDEVLQVLGQPDSFHESFWSYDFDTIYFSQGRVRNWSNVSGTLKAKQLVPPGTSKGYVTVGDTKNDVLRELGQPDSFHESFWSYDFDTIYFSQGRVRNWSNVSGTLKARMTAP